MKASLVVLWRSAFPCFIRTSGCFLAVLFGERRCRCVMLLIVVILGLRLDILSLGIAIYSYFYHLQRAREGFEVCIRWKSLSGGAGFP